jgi:hypothetical protein
MWHSFRLYDGSLFYSSLDGESNGGEALCWFTWPQTVAAGQQEAYKTHLIGGETRPELQDSLFTESYPAKTPYHQPFDETVDTMHVSYILHHHAFINGGYTGTMLETARRAHAHVGYAFVVDSVVATVTEASTSNNNDNILVDLHVTIVQVGIAPFYYDLSLVVKSNDGVLAPLSLAGVNELVDKGQSKTFVFSNIAAKQVCLRPLSLQLQSSYAYKDRPISWAQGTNGTISLTLPQVPQTCAAPSSDKAGGGFTLANLLECPLCTIL